MVLNFELNWFLHTIHQYYHPMRHIFCWIFSSFCIFFVTEFSLVVIVDSVVERIENYEILCRIFHYSQLSPWFPKIFNIVSFQKENLHASFVEIWIVRVQLENWDLLFFHLHPYTTWFFNYQRHSSYSWNTIAYSWKLNQKYPYCFWYKNRQREN